MEKKALGKGLSALIPEVEQTAIEEERIAHIPVDDIIPNKFQPRENFDEDALAELAASIKEKGVVQPVLVRRRNGGYELIAGERRLRAVKSLGVKEIPAIIRETTDAEALEISLIENLQREDLNPIEEARSYERLVGEFNFTQDKIAQEVGKDRASISNALRLLKLPGAIQQRLRDGSISAGHGRAILVLSNEAEQIKFCSLVMKKGLSVREAEEYAIKRTQGVRRKKAAHHDPHITELEEELQKLLGTRVKILHARKRGKIQIEYYSHEDFERILRLLRRRH